METASLMVLATFYYDMGGPNWNIYFSINWLDPTTGSDPLVSECLWPSFDTWIALEENTPNYGNYDFHVCNANGAIQAIRLNTYLSGLEPDQFHLPEELEFLADSLKVHTTQQQRNQCILGRNARLEAQSLGGFGRLDAPQQFLVWTDPTPIEMFPNLDAAATAA